MAKLVIFLAYILLGLSFEPGALFFDGVSDAGVIETGIDDSILEYGEEPVLD